MLGTRLSAVISLVHRFLRRWTALLGQQPALHSAPDVEAYALLSQLRRQRAAAARGPAVVMRMPHCVDDAQINLRIFM